MDWKKAVANIAKRFKEPSSWAGIAAVALAFGIQVDPSVAKSLAYFGSGVAGLVAFFVPEA